MSEKRPSEMTTVELMRWISAHGAGPAEGAALSERAERMAAMLEADCEDERDEYISACYSAAQGTLARLNAPAAPASPGTEGVR